MRSRRVGTPCPGTDWLTDGHGVSNARASLLLRILRAEEHVTAIEPAASSTVDTEPDDRSHVAA
jgi:hypothetical protein